MNDYFTFYGLEFDPFLKNSKDILLETAESAEAKTRFGYMAGARGFGVLTGAPGLGKTTVTREWAASLNPSLYRVSYNSLSSLTVMDFYRQIAASLGAQPGFRKNDIFNDIQREIRRYSIEKRITPVIIIDEADMLSHKVLSDLQIMFNFDMDSSNTDIKVEYMYGAFLLKGPIIKHKEVVWTGTVHVENCDIIQGNLNEPQVETTTRRSGGGGGGAVWYDEPEQITGVKAKSKAKKSIILSWSREENSTKYQYNYALKKNYKGGKKKYTTKNKVTIKKLKRKKTYYFRVRGMNDEYTGSWSSKKKCKVK